MGWHLHPSLGYINRPTIQTPPLRIIDCFSSESHAADLAELVKNMDLSMEVSLSCIKEEVEKKVHESSFTAETKEESIQYITGPLLDYLNELVTVMYDDPIEQIPVCLCFQYSIGKIKPSQMEMYTSLMREMIDFVPYVILFFRFAKDDMSTHYRSMSLIHGIGHPYNLKFVPFTDKDVILTARFEKKKNSWD